MKRLRLVAVPVRFALRRMLARPLAVATVMLAMAGAAGLVGWSSLASARSQEDNVRLRLRTAPSDERSVQVVYHLVAGQSDTRAGVAAFFDELGGIVQGVHRVRLWHSIGPEIRLFVPDAPERETVVAAGRLPAGCHGKVCEALALAGDFPLGSRVQLGNGAVARIVGLGSLRLEVLPTDSEALPDTPGLTSEALLVRALQPPLDGLARDTGSSVVTAAELDPDAVRGSSLRSVIAQLRQATVRLERTGPLLDAAAPLPLLDDLARRGDTARDRLLLVAGQGAALIVAFAAFLAAARRRETLALDEQLATLGASRAQIAFARVTEVVVPAVAGVLLALVGLRLAAHVVEARPPGQLRDGRAAHRDGAGDRGSDRGLLRAPRRVAGAGAPLAVRRWRTGASRAHRACPDRLAGRRDRRTRPGSDRSRRRSGPHPAPAARVGVLRHGRGLAPPRPAGAAACSARRPEGLVRRASRIPERGAQAADAAAATTFLALALGSSLFALNYRATLDRQARDEAAFAAGARWRVFEHLEADREDTGSTPVSVGLGGDVHPPTLAELPPLTRSSDVTPLTRFANATSERATPVLRLQGQLREAGAAGESPDVQVVALPAARIPQLLGWRGDFSKLSPAAIAHRLRPRPVRLEGIRLAADARSLRLWVRAETDLERNLVLHFLLPDEARFVHVSAGPAPASWRRVQLRLPTGLRGASLVGIEFPPPQVPLSAPPDNGRIELGGLEQRRPTGWVPLRGLGRWTASKGGGSTAALTFEADAPVRRGLDFYLQGAPLALVRPRVPEVLPGLASDQVAAAAVDGMVTVDGLGGGIRIRVAGRAQLFPTVVEQPRRFVVLDYDALFAVLNADQPGVALPSEAWFFRPQRPDFLTRLAKPPFRVETAVGAEPLKASLLSDPLAGGARDVLGIAAAAAALLGLLGLLLGVRSALASERMLLAEYEALGVSRTTLARSAQLRLVALSSLGIAAGFFGGLLAVRLVGALVAVTGSAARPLPPIDPVVAWRANVATTGAVAAAAILTAGLLAGRAVRGATARRLRA